MRIATALLFSSSLFFAGDPTSGPQVGDKLVHIGIDHNVPWPSERSPQDKLAGKRRVSRHFTAKIGAQQRIKIELRQIEMNLGREVVAQVYVAR